MTQLTETQARKQFEWRSPTMTLPSAKKAAIEAAIPVLRDQGWIA